MEWLSDLTTFFVHAMVGIPMYTDIFGTIPIAKEIYKGNYQSFLEYMLHNYHEEIIINAFIINKIKDYKIKTKYLSKYLKYIDNWAACDTLKFDNNTKYLELSEKYIEKPNNFTKRVGIIILFTFIKTNIYGLCLVIM